MINDGNMGGAATEPLIEVRSGGRHRNSRTHVRFTHYLDMGRFSWPPLSSFGFISSKAGLEMADQVCKLYVVSTTV